VLTRLRIRNFKQFDEVDLELGQAVVLIGPNNSGKTTALQALALWELGMRRWVEKRGERPTATQRTGVTINRRDLVALPLPSTQLMWRGLSVRETHRSEGQQRTENIRVEVAVEGVTGGVRWDCGLEFDYANPESIYCRPLGAARAAAASAEPFPTAARDVRVAYLPPMSGLVAAEVRLDPGAIQVRLGEGRTAEVLRNLCHMLHRDNAPRWTDLTKKMGALFGIDLLPAEYIPERGELTMAYVDRRRNVKLDISASGRGLQQTLLLLAFLYSQPGSVLLLDEPDAHLEILRQRQIYQTLTTVAESMGSQVIAASHSEVILNEAADRDVVVAFVGKPHRIDDRGPQVLKSLKSIGFEHYYKAESTGWVLYLEGATDLAVLQAFAATLGHEAAHVLQAPFVHYIANQPRLAQEHFYGVREAKPDLVGLVILDRAERDPPTDQNLPIRTWGRREIENYLCFPEVLETYAGSLEPMDAPGPLFAQAHSSRLRALIAAAARDRIPPAALTDRTDRWWSNVKASDDFLDPVFTDFFERAALPHLMRKTDYHRLASLVPVEMIHPDVAAMLDAVVEVAATARPRG
jgi:energy-coupling factor transporter ATP-binding protein EcfA2